jgi:hypothetical protein
MTHLPNATAFCGPSLFDRSPTALAYTRLKKQFTNLITNNLARSSGPTVVWFGVEVSI